MVSVAGNTLGALAPAILGELGPLLQFTASATSGADNLVVAASQIDTEAPVEKYGGWYLFGTGGNVAGLQGRVRRNGFTGATGTFALAASFTTTPLINATWEGSGTMPRLDQDGLTGVRTCINRALRKLWVEDRIDIAATTGVNEYDLASYWWATKRRFKRLYGPDPGSSGHALPSDRDWEVVRDGDLWVLKLGSGYATGETFSLLVERPANSRIKVGGTWTDQASPTAGLSAEADACLGEWNAVYQCCLYECMKQLVVQAGGARKAYWATRAQEQRAIVSAIKLYDLDDIEGSMGEGPSEAGGDSWLDPSKGLWSGRYR